MERIQTIAGHGPIAQVAWLTEDLDRAIDQWRLFAGVGPWTVYRNVTLDGHYRGTPATVRIDVGLAYQGDTQIELIAPHDAGPSPYHDANGRVRVGMHHVAWLVDDVAAAAKDAAAAGLVPVFSAESGGGATRVAYLEAPGEPAILLELIEATPMIRDGFTAGTTAARDWDGSNPVTIFDFAA